MTQQAPALSDSKPTQITVESLGRRQRINVTVTKSDRQLKKEKRQMKKQNFINSIKATFFYTTQTSLILGGVTLLCMNFVKVSMASPVSFTVSIPLYQIVGLVLLSIFIQFEVSARRTKKSLAVQA